MLCSKHSYKHYNRPTQIEDPTRLGLIPPLLTLTRFQKPCRKVESLEMSGKEAVQLSRHVSFNGRPSLSIWNTPRNTRNPRRVSELTVVWSHKLCSCNPESLSHSFPAPSARSTSLQTLLAPPTPLTSPSHTPAFEWFSISDSAPEFLSIV